MQIIIVNDFSFVNGGVGQVALSSAFALAKAGHQVTVFSAVAPSTREPFGENPKFVLTEQQDILTEPKRLKAALQGLWNLRASRKLANLLDNCDPAKTIVHFHGWSKALSPSIFRAAQLRKFKLVCTLHDYFLACPNGAFYNYPANEICRLKPLSFACIRKNCDSRNYSFKIWRVARQFIQKYLARAPKDIQNFISISALSADLLQDHLPNNSKIFPLNNPVMVSKELTANIAKNEYFIFVGRLSREKGAVLFAQAAKMAGVKALFIGEGEYREEILKANPAAEITGWLPSAEVRNYLRKSRALVFPSLWYETHGLVVSEAAAMGVPAIVPRTSAAKEFVQDGQTGLWFHGGNLDDLVEKINLMKNPATSAEMGRSAYEQYWKNPLTMEKHLSGLERIYSEIIGSRIH